MSSLTDKDWDGWKDFTNFAYYHKIRQDTELDKENDSRKSGGVAVLVNKKYNSNRDENREDKNLEMVSTVCEAWDQVLLRLKGICAYSGKCVKWSLTPHCVCHLCLSNADSNNSRGH